MPGAYTRGMGRRTRGWLAAATAFLGASCALVAPLDGLSGGSPSGTGDGASPPADAGATDAPADEVTDATADAAGDAGTMLDTGAMDAAADTHVADADAASVDAPADAPPDAAPSVYRAAVLADMPLAYWRLGEASGTVAHDETGKGHDGTYAGAFTLGTPGALAGDANTAVTLDGVTGEIDVGDNFDFAGQVPFSFEAWVKPAVIDSQFRHVVTKMAFDTQGFPQVGTYVILEQGNTTLGFERWQDGGTLLAVETAAFPAAGKWAHVVATYDGSTGTLYVDGAAVQSAASTGGVQANGVPMLWGNLLHGVLDEIAVYGAALPASRVTAHYDAAQ